MAPSEYVLGIKLALLSAKWLSPSLPHWEAGHKAEHSPLWEQIPARDLSASRLRNPSRMFFSPPDLPVQSIQEGSAEMWGAPSVTPPTYTASEPLNHWSLPLPRAPKKEGILPFHPCVPSAQDSILHTAGTQQQ